jgi:hypothetical protein
MTPPKKGGGDSLLAGLVGWSFLSFWIFEVKRTKKETHTHKLFKVTPGMVVTSLENLEDKTPVFDVSLTGLRLCFF